MSVSCVWLAAATKDQTEPARAIPVSVFRAEGGTCPDFVGSPRGFLPFGVSRRAVHPDRIDGVNQLVRLADDFPHRRDDVCKILTAFAW
ncbi:MAG: hypothetical protein IIB57_07045 [Planctomycetes bacterium]|nr:hypothetical protein [Planctomycetota bacterium]